jgi:hypothetical protein
MLSEEALVEALSSSKFKRLDKILITLGAVEQPAAIALIRAKAVGAGLRDAQRWNLSDYLRGASELVRPLPTGWQLTDAGWDHIRALGLSAKSPIVSGTARSLKGIVDGVSDVQRREFLSDALLCFDKGATKPAVVYSWVGAAWILQQHIIQRSLAAFNAAGSARYNKTGDHFKPIRSIESFGRVQEADMLQVMEDIGLIGKSLHKQLKDRLDLRNGCGHPSTMVVDDHTCAAHIHFLIDNVYRRF